MISIIIPFFNGREYIERCLQSFFNQTSKNFELLLIDDGSTVSSDDLILPYFKKLNIKSIHTKHNGVSYARNVGIKNSVGEIIGFCDVDDVVNCNLVKIIENISFKTKCDLIYTGVYVENNKEKIEMFQHKYYNQIITEKKEKSKFLDEVLFDNNVYGAVWNKFFKRSIIEYEFNENISILEDLYFIFNNIVSTKKITIYRVDVPLYCYINNKKSVTHDINKLYKDDKNKYIISLEMMKEQLDLDEWEIKKLNAKIVEIALENLIQNYFTNKKQLLNLLINIKHNIKDFWKFGTYPWKHKIKFTMFYVFTFVKSIVD